MPESFIRVNNVGDLEQIDLTTGEIRILTDDPYTRETIKNEYVRVKDGEELVWVPKAFNPALLPSARFVKYSEQLAEKVCDLVAQGLTWKAICSRQDMPSYAVMREWRRVHPEFAERLELARNDRADTYIERAEAAVLAAVEHPDSVALARLRADFYKWMAKVSNPREFAETTKVDAKVAVGYAAIETGIRRPGDPGYLMDERTREVQDVGGARDGGDRGADNGVSNGDTHSNQGQGCEGA